MKKLLYSILDTLGISTEYHDEEERIEIAKGAAGAANEILRLIGDTYTLVEWPYSQEYMDEEWFEDEAVLSADSSYFIPTRYVEGLEVIE